MTRTVEIVLPWYPQPRQMEAITACGLAGLLVGGSPGPPVAEVIGYGGAAGGGKTDALLGVGMLACWAFPGCNVVFFRRTYPELDGPGGAILRSRELFSGFASYDSTAHVWSFPNGSIFKFAHCQSAGDVYRYQSQQFDVLLIDEATHFLEDMVLYLKTRNRATVDGLVPFMLLATNPGGVGHLWYKHWFVDQKPWGEVHRVYGEDGVLGDHLFIRALLSDNAILEERDPGYRSRLENQKAGVRRALLHGDWDVFEGMFFDTWDKSVHVIPQRPVEDGWFAWGGLDWGYRAPFGHLWLARNLVTEKTLVYNEAYQKGLTDPEQAILVRESTPPWARGHYSLADPSMWAKRTTEKEARSSADVYREYGVTLRKAMNARIAGWRRVNEMLKPDGRDGPKLQIMENCENLIRVLPAMVHDETHIEDIAPSPHDHLVDALRYALSWKLIGERIEPDVPDDMWGQSRRGSNGVRARRLAETLPAPVHAGSRRIW